MKRLFTLLSVLIALPAFSQNYELAPTFGDEGVVRHDIWPGSEQFNSHVLLPDGKLLLGGFGYWNSPNSFRVKMIRIDTICGALDPDFGDEGTLSYTFEQRTRMYDMAVQEDGAIVGCGQMAPSNAGSQQRPAVFRFLPDGAPDLTFNETGYHKAGFDNFSSGHLWKLFVLEDGRITCAGSSMTNINGGTPGIGVQRFMPDGSLDTTFAGNGVSRISLSGSGYGISGQYGSAVMQPDSMVVAIAVVTVGSARSIALARFDFDGNPDTTFGDNGLVLTDVPIATNEFSDDGLGAALLDDGRILVSGRSAGSPHHFFMARFMPDGELDDTYGDEGISLVTPPGSSPPVGKRMHLLEDGSTLQFGTSHWSAGPPTIVKRLPNGLVDTDFGTNGVRVVPTGVSNEKFWGGFVMPGGDILAYGGGGGSGSVMAVRLTQDPESDGFVDIGEDVSFCEGDSALLDAGNPGGSYQWSNGATSQTIYVNSGGTIGVTVTLPNGCSHSDQVDVTLLPAPDLPIIESDNGFDLVASGSGSFQWLLDGEEIPGANAPTWTAQAVGTYTVQVTGENGCSITSAPFEVVALSTTDQGMVRIHVWPNPANEAIHVGISTRWTHAEAIDLAGRVLPLKVDGNGRIPISHLAGGTYVLRLTAGTEMAVSRFVKW